MKAALLLVLFFLQGCAAKKLAVSNADTIMEQQIKKRLPLYAPQKKALQKDIDHFLNSHKPLVQKAVPIIDELKIDNMEQVEIQYHQLLTLYKHLALDFSKLMSKYMAKLDQKQQKEFFNNLDLENAQIGRRNLKDQMADLHDRFTMLFGSINEDQRTMLEGFEIEFARRNKARLERRQRLHEAFREIFKGDHKEQRFEEAFKRYQDEAYEPKGNLELLKKLLPTLTIEQKETFREKSQELKDLINYYMSVEF